MKAFGAALIALAILCVVDFEYNDGRFAGVIERAVTSLVSAEETRELISRVCPLCVARRSLPMRRSLCDRHQGPLEFREDCVDLPKPKS